MTSRPAPQDDRRPATATIRPGGPLDLTLRIAGGLVAVWGSIVATLLEAFLVPLRIDGVRAPICLLLAVVGNIALMRFAHVVTGSRLFALLPGLVWFGVTIVLSTQTGAGDTVLVGGDWVPLALLLLGAASVAVGAYLVVVPRRR
ncbi:hypothetical protein Athai_51550 [Actinocatenispora thailandica]|uniref:Uncharacterized protein n=1 Tax=Actinocatenispora thailandica TaxID=227318 RepID=A0A7R7DUG1_9ACTN|nr:hypothetical protein [Actinocatenispora thailandica]BCJ37652.1 hypothetical protein Athai_51550 [Actinocatenispora thailandica]